MRMTPRGWNFASAAFLLAAGCPGGDDDETGASATESSTASSTGTPSSGDDNGPGPDDDGPTSNTGTVSADSTAAQMSESSAGDTTTGGNTEVPPCPYEAVAGTPGVTLELIASGCDRPLQAVGHPTQPDRLFVVEQGGNIRIVEPGSSACGDTFLHVSAANANSQFLGPEAGLLGFAFHPNFPSDPRVYVSYNPPSSDRLTVEEYSLMAGDPDQADPASARTIITWGKPASNHNGGAIMFGPEDGYLYITAGDGGVQFDGDGNARDPNALLGKVMRIDVEDTGESHDPSGCDGCPTFGPFNYTIPKDNPFVGDPDFAPEIWAFGFRNPWRAAFDPPTNRLYVGDVGQGSYEEVSVVEGGGGDFGWSMLEGLHCTPSAQYSGYDPDCDDSAAPGGTTKLGQIQPLAELSAGQGAHSVIGLSVYRSCQVPAWDGLYFYSDHYTQQIYALAWDGNTVDDLGNVFGGLTSAPTGNGYNAWGDVYVTSVEESGGFVEDGHIWRVVPAS